MDKLNKKFQSEDKAFTKAEGVIHVNPKGFGFVTPDDQETYPEDVFIPKHQKGGAVDGDRVEVAVSPHQKANKGPEGVVTSILKRAKEQLVGTVWSISQKGNLTLYIQSLGKAKTALVHKPPQQKYQIGDRLRLNVEDWGDEKDPALCTILEKLGTIDEAKTDIPAAILDFGIRKDFPKEVHRQVKTYSTKVESEDCKGREDLTHLETFTIDPDTARDFDDALSLTEDEKGQFHLGVHIADVSHYVKEGTPLDSEAKKRSNSTYFPGECVPMLPEELSNHLCSLKEKVVRLTLSVLMTLDPTGTLINFRIVRGFIKSRKRFTYKQAKQVLDGKEKSPHTAALKRMEKLCLLLKQKRFERGSFELALPEIVINIDKQGAPTGYEIVEYDITHQLVEEFMLKANEVVATHFSQKGQEAIYRIHEPPGEDQLADFYALSRSLGFPLPQNPQASDIQKLFELAKKSPHAEQLSIAYIRSMKLAIYSKENIGHYGLALENYCHFTSPIRRYSDLVIHRLLFEPSTIDLKKVSEECSAQERVSFKAEMQVLLMKKLRLLELYQKEDPARVYGATVSKIKPFGLFFEVSPIQYEGFFPLSELHDDYYDYQPKTATLMGQNQGKCYKVGMPLEVQLERIDLITTESKWALYPLPKRRKKSPSRSSKGKTWSKSGKNS